MNTEAATENKEVCHFLPTNLKRLRGKKSQEDMSALLELKRSSYSGYENGAAEPSLKVLIRMAEHHRVTLDTLVRTDLRKWSNYQLEHEQCKNPHRERRTVTVEL